MAVSAKTRTNRDLRVTNEYLYQIVKKKHKLSYLQRDFSTQICIFWGKVIYEMSCHWALKISQLRT